MSFIILNLRAIGRPPPRRLMCFRAAVRSVRRRVAGQGHYIVTLFAALPISPRGTSPT